MSQQLCLLHANCQGVALKALLEKSPQFCRHFRIEHLVNYTSLPLGTDALNRCGLFLHQYLAPKWGDLATEQTLARLPGHALHICVPNYFFKGYWPFWTNSTDVIEFADSLLEELLARGVGHAQARFLYLKGSPELLGDVEAVAQASLEQEKTREIHTPIKYVELMEGLWREEQLFITINHPGHRLLVHEADSILRLLGYPPLSKEAASSFIHPQGDFWLPVHPALKDALGLPFALPQRRYPCFAAQLTHQEYISCYLGCRKYGIADLTGVLRGERQLPAGARI